MRKRPPTLALQVEFGAQLANLLEAGFTIETGLKYFEATRPKNAALFLALEQELAAGEALNKVLETQQFHSAFIVQVQLAEVHGNLVSALRSASEYLRLQLETRQKVVQQLTYPVVLLSLLLVLQTSLAFGLLPGSENLFRFGDQLVFWIISLVLIVGGSVLWHILNEVQRFALSRWIPGIGTLLQLYYQLQFLAGLAAFLTAGQRMSDYLQQLKLLPAGVLRQAAGHMVTALEQGASLENVLQGRVVAGAARELLRIGQTQVFVATGMQLLSQQLLKRLEQQIQRFVAWIQPLFFAVIALQIVLLYQQVLTNIYGGI